MTTITLKINEQTKAGKAFLSMVKFFSEDKNDVEIIEQPNEETLKAMYEAKNKIGVTKTNSHEDLMDKLFS